MFTDDLRSKKRQNGKRGNVGWWWLSRRPRENWKRMKAGKRESNLENEEIFTWKRILLLETYFSMVTPNIHLASNFSQAYNSFKKVALHKEWVDARSWWPNRKIPRFKFCFNLVTRFDPKPSFLRNPRIRDYAKF